MSDNGDVRSDILATLRGIAFVLFALQLSIIGVFAGDGSFWLLLAGFFIGVIGVIATLPGY
ncbi:hypothetical protein NDI56_20750 [Haloarcula sp. S1CR25-12]|jgi:hypothetical protein|uniref:Uncharacterized protein n=2 Tax=Haloarcula TaxID=2237 RepID=A0A8J7YHB4_9EURY|nr:MULTISPECIES: hypothetical protein [Haloarculaceae]MBX0287898.1 hypothetical protein [Halomicroarcula salinisoli]MBX0305507.1 hypothetical protein [Halomicroarcula salinisoli]MDS0261837.1 hypothetical protein [Haloarcula sp. S1CR25-12]